MAASASGSSSRRMSWRWPPPLAYRLRPVTFELAPPSALAVHPWGVLALLLRSPTRLLDGLTSAHHRLLDRAAATLTQNPVLFPNGFFCDGWGDLNTPQRLREVLQSNRMREVNALGTKDIVWTARRELPVANARIQEGRFRSTLPNARQYLPEESLDAFCELVTPLEWAQPDGGLPLGAPNRPLVGRLLSVTIEIEKGRADGFAAVVMTNSAAAGNGRARLPAPPLVHRATARAHGHRHAGASYAPVSV